MGLVIYFTYSKFTYPFFFKLIYLFSAALGLHRCVQAFSSCSELGLLFIVVHGLLIAVTSLVMELRLQDVWASVLAAHGLHSCDP